MPRQRGLVLHSVLSRVCWAARSDMDYPLRIRCGACCVVGPKSRVFWRRIFTSETSQCEFHNMGALVRQGHFLGAKLRSLRKRNGLTLEELSARCVQIDAAAAPSVSYLSMIENGQRMPSGEMLGLLAGIFGKPPGWFLDKNTELAAEPKRTSRGGLAAMPLEPGHLFSPDLLKIALPELLSQTATTGKQFAQLLIRVWQETRHNDFPDIERAAEQIGDRRMPLEPNDLLAIAKRLGLQIRWFDAKDEPRAM